MKKHISYLLALGLWLAAGCQSAQQPVPIAPTLSDVTAPQEPTRPAGIPRTEAPNSSPGCYYIWATRELPNLSSMLAARLASVGSGFEASAYAFGEECRADSGSVTFLAMETDFRVRASVPTLEDEDALGNAISGAMLVIDALPAKLLVGTRPGRVEFEFTNENSESLRLIVDIARFRQEAAGQKGADLFRLFAPPG